MGKLSLRGLVGTIKDKASESKAALTSKPHALISLLRATSHHPHAPPSAKHIAGLLSLGRSSRASASAAIEALMERLTRTGDAHVALKCLIAAHHVAASGAFILRDQLSAVPSAGGRNYLNLSRFRDASSHTTWHLSDWVRWYGLYVESLVSVSRTLGFFLAERASEPSALTNSELVRETDSLVTLLELICNRPETQTLPSNKLVEEIKVLVGRDCLLALEEVGVRAVEFRERKSCLSFGDSVQVVCALKRLETCRHRLGVEIGLGFWGVVSGVKDIVGKERDDTLISINKRTNHFRIESARFADRLPDPGNSLKFGSGRFSVTTF